MFSNNNKIKLEIQIYKEIWGINAYVGIKYHLPKQQMG